MKLTKKRALEQVVEPPFCKVNCARSSPRQLSGIQNQEVPLLSGVVPTGNYGHSCDNTPVLVKFHETFFTAAHPQKHSGMKHRGTIQAADTCQQNMILQIKNHHK